MEIDKIETERLFRSHYARMYRLAKGILYDDEDARDVVSDVFAKLLDREKPAEICGGDGAGTASGAARREEQYLLMAVRNRCLNLISHRQADEKARKAWPMEAEAGLTAAEMEREEQRLSDIRQFIDTGLTPRTRGIMMMRYGEQRACRDISAECGISLTAVYKHLAQGLEKLKERFNP